VKRAVGALVAGALAAGCGGDGGNPSSALRETADKLGTIRSGIITFSMKVDPQGEGEPFGFELRGPFELADEGELPRADVEYTQIANGQSETVRLVSDGDRAVALAGGRSVPLEEAALRNLRGAGAVLGTAGGEDEGLEELRVDEWLVDPELSDGPGATDMIGGELDIVAVANGLLELAGAETRRLDAATGKQLRDAVESAEFELLTGDEDRLLRRLALDVDLAAEVPEELRQALGEVVGADFSFVLEIGEPNEPVEIDLP
jgi:hypothetical protein